jgi:RNA polymerase sigma factor (TIGR02999 family)
VSDANKPADVTRLLHRAAQGDAIAKEELLPHVLGELRRLAERRMRGKGDETLQPTALINEAWLRLFGSVAAGWRDRRHFFAVAATAMRHVLVDRARARRTVKKGGEYVRVPLDEALAQYEERHVDVVAVHEALERLTLTDPDLAELVELHFFAGLTMQEIAALTAVTERTVYARWRLVRAWLRGQLMGDDPQP